MGTKFTYFGGMAVLVERSDGYKILCDPYISKNPATDVDVSTLYDVDLLLVTHAAFDHFGDTIEIMKNSNAVLMAGADVIRLVNEGLGEPLPKERVRNTIYGDEQFFGQTTVHTAVTFHTSNTTQNGVFTAFFPFGFIVEIEPGVTYYHAGDTCLFGDMRLIHELYKPNVMAVGVSRIEPQYPTEMPPREAAHATLMIGADVVIPTHYAPGSSDLEKFLKYVEAIAPNTKTFVGANRSFVYTPFQIEEL